LEINIQPYIQPSVCHVTTDEVDRIAGTSGPTKGGRARAINHDLAPCGFEIAVETMLNVFVRIEQVLADLLDGDAKDETDI
jgi:hypothetical protein